MEEYTDDINFINLFIKDNFPRSISFSDSRRDDVIYFRKADSEYWASRQALGKCSEDPLKDPIEVLDKLENDYEINSLFAKQIINKEHYENAKKAITFIKEKLLERRTI